MRKCSSHRCGRHSCVWVLWFILLLNGMIVPQMTQAATCHSNSSLFGRPKTWITSSPREGKKLFLMEKRDCCLLLCNWVLAVWHQGPCSRRAHFFSPLTSHTLIRRDDGRSSRWQPSLELQIVSEIHLAVIQLISARGCRLINETPWSVAVDPYPL